MNLKALQILTFLWVALFGLAQAHAKAQVVLTPEEMENPQVLDSYSQEADSPQVDAPQGGGSYSQGVTIIRPKSLSKKILIVNKKENVYQKPDLKHYRSPLSKSGI